MEDYESASKIILSDQSTFIIRLLVWRQESCSGGVAGRWVIVIGRREEGEKEGQ